MILHDIKIDSYDEQQVTKGTEHCINALFPIFKRPGGSPDP